MANRADAVRISLKVAVQGNIALRDACSSAASCSWPMAARKFYLSQAECRVAYVAPLAIADPKFGFKMKVLQLRWAMAVILGRPPGNKMLSLGSTVAETLLSDLGWQSLWASMAASAISLLSSMANDLPGFVHAQVACASDPPLGSWVDAVRKLMQRYDIRMWQPGEGVLPGTASWTY
jgi:hypothetical protein